MAGPVDPIQASKVQPEAVDWLWRERIPRKMLIAVGGRADEGKGLWWAYVASEVSRTKYPTGKGKGTRKGRVLISAMEDSHSLMTRPRLEAARADLDQVDLWRFRLPAQFEQLESVLRSKPYDLVIIDPVASHLTNGVTRFSDNIRKVTDPLSELIEETGTACVFIEHVLKRVPQSGHPLAAFGGAGSGLIAAVRMAFLVGTDPKDGGRKILACVKHNIRDKPAEIAFAVDVAEVDGSGEIPALLYDKEIEFDPMQFLQRAKEGRTGRPPDKRAAAAEWLTNYLYAAIYKGLPETKDAPAVPPGPVPAGRVKEDAKLVGIPKNTLYAAAKDQQIVRNPPGGGPKCEWSLPDELRAILDEANGINVETEPVVLDTSGPVSASQVPKAANEAAAKAALGDKDAIEAGISALLKDAA